MPASYVWSWGNAPFSSQLCVSVVYPIFMQYQRAKREAQRCGVMEVQVLCPWRPPAQAYLPEACPLPKAHRLSHPVPPHPCMLAARHPYPVLRGGGAAPAAGQGGGCRGGGSAPHPPAHHKVPHTPGGAGRWWIQVVGTSLSSPTPSACI
eukprot:CAMPEP_0202893862 /NCGR_PEP_ID=MMETSP1392-20130828/3366_1 /ASSEMBLY_ACC=CAM_ASM_000868 /TAXON_ID=225041 /ORGANISM="Chlamydomonas chlamydogama, Strain SAG 11-48b" /LENGTH=149 /DNA_ID=CAMNT_0049578349 /DNA_START=99 /DNA_END=545 /DNA_ORIENTATION=-